MMTLCTGQHLADKMRLTLWGTAIVVAFCVLCGCYPTTGTTIGPKQEETIDNSPKVPTRFLASNGDSTLTVTDENREEVFSKFDTYFHKGINFVDLEIEATCDEIKQVCGIKHLRFLDIPYGYCEVLQIELFDLPQLKMLRLFIPYSITSIPEEISQLQGLSSLTIVGPDVKVLPKSLVKMPHLSGLDLAETSIEELPLWLGEIKTLNSILIPYGYETEKVNNLEEFKKANPHIKII